MLEIRRAERDELARVAEIHVDSWRIAYRGLLADSILDSLSVASRAAAWEEWFEQPGSELWVALRAGRVDGFSRFQPAPDPDLPAEFAELTHLYLEPTVVGTGVGGALFHQVLESARVHPYRGVALWVLEENARARRFYERRGFVADGEYPPRPEWLGRDVREVRYRIGLSAGAA